MGMFGMNDGDRLRLYYYRLTAISKDMIVRVDQYPRDVGEYCIFANPKYGNPRPYIKPFSSLVQMKEYTRETDDEIIYSGMISTLKGEDKVIREAFKNWFTRNFPDIEWDHNLNNSLNTHF